MLILSTSVVQAQEAESGFYWEVQISAEQTASELYVALYDESGIPLCADAAAGCNVNGVPTSQSAFAVASGTVFNISTARDEGGTAGPIHLTLDSYFNNGGDADFLTVEVTPCDGACALPQSTTSEVPPTYQVPPTYYVYSHRAKAFEVEERSFFNPYRGNGAPDVVISGIDTPDGFEVHGWASADTGSPSLEEELGSRYVFPYDCARRNCSSSPFSSTSAIFLARVEAKPTATQRVFTFSGAGDVLIPAEWDPVWDLDHLRTEFPENRRLVVEGDLAADGVVFTEATPGQGWGGLRFEAGSSGALSEVVIEKAQASSSVYVYNADVTFTDAAIRDGLGTGLRAFGSQADVTFRRSVNPNVWPEIVRHTNAGVQAASSATVSIEGTTISDMGVNGVTTSNYADVTLFESEVTGSPGFGARAGLLGTVTYGKQAPTANKSSCPPTGTTSSTTTRRGRSSAAAAA